MKKLDKLILADMRRADDELLAHILDGELHGSGQEQPAGVLEGLRQPYFRLLNLEEM